ncbi:proline iminopeptidase-family hydrolase [Methanocalculus sp.]|uniref:proline iminopeptidase-family hydrolase n=1 Tax=Methanocalculus sp. TaxID=2004547 RepID=UPI0026160B74|nr:proline iminopeptidase-family hydrolase [Methanocalculus sp.]MDG6250690.1 proline iminopeptidase-family hydrolase [Methanocalculus sp.]
MNTRREGKVSVSGGEVGYSIAGGDTPGIPLILVHGGPGGSYDAFEPFLSLAHSRPVICYDQLGSYRSPAPVDDSLLSLERFADELHAVRTALAPGRVHLLGHSFGAMVVLAYIGKYGQEDIASLTLAGPLISSPRWEADQRRLLAGMPPDTRAVIEMHESCEVYDSPAYQEAMMAYYRRHLCRMDPWPDCLNRMFEYMAAPIYLAMWGPSEFTVRGSLREKDLKGVLRELRLPVLFTCGEFDEATPLAVRDFCDLTDGAVMKIFAGASHMHFLEAEEEFMAVLSAFLDGADR